MNVSHADLFHIGGQAEPDAVKAADPIAKPFPVAAVVFPRLSSASVRSRTTGSRPAHFRVAAGVVGDRAVSVGGQGDTKGAEHTDGGDADAVEAHGEVRNGSSLKLP